MAARPLRVFPHCVYLLVFEREDVAFDWSVGARGVDGAACQRQLYPEPVCVCRRGTLHGVPEEKLPGHPSRMIPFGQRRIFFGGASRKDWMVSLWAAFCVSTLAARPPHSGRLCHGGVPRGVGRLHCRCRRLSPHASMSVRSVSLCPLWARDESRAVRCASLAGSAERFVH